MTTPKATKLTAEQLASRLHEAYERRAPEHGYATRQESRVPWDQLPENHKQLMRLSVEEAVEPLLAHISALEGELEEACLAFPDPLTGEPLEVQALYDQARKRGARAVELERRVIALQAALREVMSRTRPRLTGWSEPTARALKGLGL